MNMECNDPTYFQLCSIFIFDSIISPQEHYMNQYHDGDQMTGRFREQNYDERYMYASPYPQYPHAYTSPGFPASGGSYGTSYPAHFSHTPQFVVNEHTFSKTDQQFYKQGNNQRIDEAVEKKLVFDVGTSPENPEAEVQTDPDYAEMFSDKQIQPEFEIRRIPEQPSFIPSPSKYDTQNRSSSMNIDAVTRGWIDALQLLDSGDYQSAYETIISTGDDIYLLRLVSLTGPVVKNLHPKTAAVVVKKLNQIIRCNIFPIFATDWIEDSLHSGAFKSFKERDKDEYLDTLHLFSQDRSDAELSQKASDLYNEIMEDEKE